MKHSAATSQDAAQGALIGALVGDAAGAHLEFIGRQPSPEEVQRALDLVGGGVFSLAPGQVTDDGELTFSLARALAAAGAFDIEGIAAAYADWLGSDPFDIGHTTRMALRAGAGIDRTKQGIASAMAEAARRHCAGSKANGGLMRIVPLAIFGHQLAPATLARLAACDSLLSHPNASCRLAAAAYTIAIASLVQHPGDRSRALALASSWLEAFAEEHAGSEVCTWLREARQGVRLPFWPQAGFVRIAFTEAFRHLEAGSSFEQALRETLAGGGDTDTNACIVGGLVGAAVGVDGIPAAMRQRIEQCDTRSGRHPRPEAYRPGQGCLLATRLLEVGGTAPRVNATSPSSPLVESLSRDGKLPLASIEPLAFSPRLAHAIPWDRVEGMLLGLAIGDSLGNTSESMNPSERSRAYGWIDDYRPNRHADGRAVGLPSDDSQMAFWLLEQYLQDDFLSPQHLAESFCREQIFGKGSAVRAFIRAFKDDHQPWQKAGTPSAGAGALMRIAPIVVPHLSAPSRSLWDETVLAAMVTHNDATSIAACVAFVRLLWELLQADQAPEPTWYAEQFVRMADPLEGATRLQSRVPGVDYCGPLSAFVAERVPPAINTNMSVIEAGNQWYSGAYLLETVPTVLHILGIYGKDPEEAILRAVNETRDNDTIAAIVGAAVGALHGRQALPSRWIDKLLGRTRCDDDGHVFALIAEAKARWGHVGIGP